MEKTLAKGLAVLEALVMFDEPIGVSELALALGMSKSNAHRLLRTLLELGFVASDEGRYWATLKVWELGSQVVKRYSVKDFSRPLMIRLAEKTEEEVRLILFDEPALEVICIDKIDSAQDVRAFSEIGGRSPAYCTSSGKAFLAYQSDEVVARALQGLTAQTKWTITDPVQFSESLAKVRADGYALNVRELSEQVSGVAAPIFGRDRSVVASISVIGPAERFPLKRLREIGEITRDACMEVSARISPPPPFVRIRPNVQGVSPRKRKA